MKMISTPDAPRPAGHYSQAVVCGGIVYLAGQLARNPASPDSHPGDAAHQTKQILANVSAILDAAGSALDQVLQVTIYITDMTLWPEVDAAYASVMGDHRPARAVVPVGPLHGDYVIEMQVMAALP